MPTPPPETDPAAAPDVAATAAVAQAIIGGKLLDNGCSLTRANAREHGRRGGTP